MSNELTTQPNRYATLFCANTSKAIEHYRAELDADKFYAGTYPPGSAPTFLAASEEHRRAMAPIGSDGARKALMALRSQTILTNESTAESKASFEAILRAVQEIPADILMQGCTDYVRAPGKRFFPRSAGELLAFTNPLTFQRKRRQHRLKMIADAAEAADQDRARLTNGDRIDPSEVADANALMESQSLKTRYRKDGTPYQIDKAANPV